MGRHKKNTSAVLVGLVDSFYETEAKGDARRLKFSNLARYAESQGVQAAWYDFQRDETVARRITELQEKQLETDSFSVVAAYKTLDIEALLNNCRTLDELKKGLYELDRYWKCAYDSYVQLSEQNRKLTEQAQDLSQKIVALSEKADAAAQEASALQRENKYLRRVIRENLYPAVANELLRMAHLPTEENHTVRPDALPHLIEGDTPQSLGGVQQAQPKKPSHQEQLLADMLAQVKKHGK